MSVKQSLAKAVLAIKLWAYRARPWAWTTVRDTGITVYQVHADGRRRAWQRGGGYQPIDRGWLASGEWSRYRVPPFGPSPIRRRSA